MSERLDEYYAPLTAYFQADINEVAGIFCSRCLTIIISLCHLQHYLAKLFLKSAITEQFNICPKA